MCVHMQIRTSSLVTNLAFFQLVVVYTSTIYNCLHAYSYTHTRRPRASSDGVGVSTSCWTTSSKRVCGSQKCQGNMLHERSATAGNDTLLFLVTDFKSTNRNILFVCFFILIWGFSLAICSVLAKAWECSIPPHFHMPLAC